MYNVHNSNILRGKNEFPSNLEHVVVNKENPNMYAHLTISVKKNVG